jgi:hypothetical protein
MLVFSRFLVRILARAPAILIKVCCGFLQLFWTNSEIVS